MVPTVALLDQWVVVYPDDLGVTPEDIAMFGGGRRPTRPRLFNVMVINTARSIAPTIAAGRPTFLIIDECHRAASLHNALSLRGDHVATLGLSATPERDFDDLFSEVVVPVLGSVIYRYDYPQALADRVITTFDLTNVHVPLSFDEQAKYDKLTHVSCPCSAGANAAKRSMTDSTVRFVTGPESVRVLRCDPGGDQDCRRLQTYPNNRLPRADCSGRYHRPGSALAWPPCGGVSQWDWTARPPGQPAAVSARRD